MKAKPEVGKIYRSNTVDVLVVKVEGNHVHVKRVGAIDEPVYQYRLAFFMAKFSEFNN